MADGRQMEICSNANFDIYRPIAAMHEPVVTDDAVAVAEMTNAIRRARDPDAALLPTDRASLEAVARNGVRHPDDSASGGISRPKPPCRPDSVVGAALAHVDTSAMDLAMAFAALGTTCQIIRDYEVGQRRGAVPWALGRFGATSESPLADHELSKIIPRDQKWRRELWRGASTDRLEEFAPPPPRIAYHATEYCCDPGQGPA